MASARVSARPRRMGKLFFRITSRLGGRRGRRRGRGISTRRTSWTSAITRGRTRGRARRATRRENWRRLRRRGEGPGSAPGDVRWRYSRLSFKLILLHRSRHLKNYVTTRGVSQPSTNVSTRSRFPSCASAVPIPPGYSARIAFLSPYAQRWVPEVDDQHDPRRVLSFTRRVVQVIPRVVPRVRCALSVLGAVHEAIVEEHAPPFLPPYDFFADGEKTQRRRSEPEERPNRPQDPRRDTKRRDERPHQEHVHRVQHAPDRQHPSAPPADELILEPPASRAPPLFPKVYSARRPYPHPRGCEARGARAAARYTARSAA